MSNIRVDTTYTIQDGAEVKFRSPVDCSAVTGLIVYYPGVDGVTTSKVFAFADAHGNNVGNIDYLFAENVVVKVILDVTTSMAFVQNADTNAYLEAQLASKRPNTWLPTPEEIGAAATNRVITSANTTTYSGMYRIQQADDVPTACRYGQLLVMCHSGTDTIAQIAMATDGSKAYIRGATGMSNGVVSTWTDWAQIYTTANKPTASDVGAIPTDPTTRTQIPSGSDIKAFFLTDGLPLGSYYYYPETAPVNAPLDRTDWWFFNRTPVGVYAMCSSEPNRKWVGANMNGTFYGWDEIYTSNNLTPEIIGAVPTTRTINGKTLDSDIALSAADVGARPNTWMPTASDVGAAKYEFINGGTIRKVDGGTGFEIHLNPADPPENGAWFFVQRLQTEGNYLVIATTLNNEMYISSKPYGADWSGWSHLATTNNTVPTSRTVNGKSLSSDVTLSATDVGAVVGVGQVSVSANTITTSGMYRLQEATDIPSGAQYGQLIVVHGGGDTISQIALNYNSSKMWIRTGYSLYDGVVGNWGAWKRVITEDSFVLDGSTLRITI